MIKPTKETPVPNGPEEFEYQYQGNTIIGKTGVTKNLVLQLRRFRANTDGTNAVETAPVSQIHLYGPGVSPDPKTKAAVAKYNAANEAALQQLVNDLGE